jgi:hypothetical protein
MAIKNPPERQFMEQVAHSPFVSLQAHDGGMPAFSFLPGIVEEGIGTGEI